MEGQQKPDLEELRCPFDRFDTDNNGRIDFQEFSDLLEVTGPLPTEEEKQIAFTVIDTDGNGTVSLDEFISWWLDQ